MATPISVSHQVDTRSVTMLHLVAEFTVRVYAKLPGWFTVPTPLGGYNPDWAVLISEDDAERLYFVVETKSGLFADALRDQERAKVDCGKAHFAALAVSANPARFRTATKLDDLLG
jgi:type III restriction enzyme